jgi:hypothetical protein
VVSSQPTAYVPCLLVDDTNLYWDFFAMPKGGGTVTFLPGNYNLNSPLSCAQSSAYVYVANKDGVLKVWKSGPNYVQLAYVDGAYNVAVDSTDVYWTFWDQNKFAGVSKTSLVGGAPVFTLSAEKTQVPRLGIKVDGAYVYTYEPCTPQCGSIARTPIGGGLPEIVVGKLNDVWDVELDGTSLYWAESNNGSGGRIMKLTPK